MNCAPFAVFASLVVCLPCQEAPDGTTRLWNGVDLQGWHGQRHFDPYQLAALPPEQRAKLRAEDDASVAQHWRVVEGELVNDGEGAYLTTDREYGDVDLRLEYRTVAKADSGIYLRGTPQVQIWDTTEAGGKWHLGADKGSGGLWNNQVHERFPLVHADRPFGEWNGLRIVQAGATTWVWLNDQLVVDGVVMENFWDRGRALPRRGVIQLQTHGGEIRFRNLTVREIGPAEAVALLAARDSAAFTPLWDGATLDGWQGAVDDYEVVDGAVRCRPGRGGNLFTRERFADFTVRVQFRLPKGGNNGLAIRYPGEGNPSQTGLEVQVLDDGAPQYEQLKQWQYCGSVYGLVPAQRGHLQPQGEWNLMEVTMVGSRATVVLNGTPVVDADLAGIEQPASGEPHPGRRRLEGHFGFCGHQDPVEFRGMAIRRR